MSSGRLLLHPGQAAIEPGPVIACLDEISFIGAPYRPPGAPDAVRWLAGERFARLVTFLGCSPHLRFDPPDDGGSFCHIELDGPHARPRFRHGPHTRAGQCPACRHRPQDWRRLIGLAERDAETPWRCPACGRTTPLGALNWRRGAGSARLFIVVHDVFPNEAVPNPELLDALQRASGQPWQRFYA